jgi:integrase
MLMHLRGSSVPDVLRGPALFDEVGFPRFWPTVWVSLVQGGNAESTVREHLRCVESFYSYADDALGTGALDDALNSQDFQAISQALEGYLLSIRNCSRVTRSEARWQTAVRFARDVLTRISRNMDSHPRFGDFDSRFLRFEGLYSHLRIGRTRKAEPIRSLPAQVVETLYEKLDPSSASNPFQNDASRWRVFILFIVLLHQGLRRGELLILPVDAVKSAFDAISGKERFWLNVSYNEYEEDPRYSKPSIKNPSSIRQVPVSEVTFRLINEYVANYRGRADHSFLMNSQKKKPLSTEGVTKVFQKITEALPKSALRILYDRTGKASISAHDLRHTCAVIRLNQLLSRGDTMDEALQKMRTFFGWARSSDMPLRYARAVFEDRLASVWSNVFDDRVAVLRNIPKSL